MCVSEFGDREGESLSPERGDSEAAIPLEPENIKMGSDFSYFPPLLVWRGQARGSYIRVNTDKYSTCKTSGGGGATLTKRTCNTKRNERDWIGPTLRKSRLYVTRRAARRAFMASADVSWIRFFSRNDRGASRGRD